MDFKELLNRATPRLFAQLDDFFPTEPTWDVLERQLVVHVAASALERGYFPYTEVSIKLDRRGAAAVGRAGNTGKVDLVLHSPPDSPTQSFWVEAKRIFAEKNAGPLVIDIDRICSSPATIKPKLPARFGGTRVVPAVMVITHQVRVAEWWESPAGTPPWKGVDWKELGARLSSATSRVQVSHMHGRPRPTFVLGATWERKGA